MEEKNKKDKLEKKDKIKKDDQNSNLDLEEAQRKIENLIKQAEEQFGVDRANIKVVKIKLPRRTFKYILIESFIKIFINIVLGLSISGYLIWAKNGDTVDLVYFLLTYSLIEIFLTNIINVFFLKAIIRTFGLVLMIAPIIAVPIVVGLTNFVEITSNTRLLVMFTALLLLRFVVKNTIINFRRGKQHGRNNYY
jgi:hypothetical protein